MPGTDPLVDWGLARSIADRVVRPGPQLSPAETAEVVADLRALAVEARGHVRQVTGLDAPAAEGPTAVVDRRTWIRSNLHGLEQLVGPVAERLSTRPLPPGARAVGSRVTALEAGGAVAWLSTKVLGQYELMGPPGAVDRPRLLLVAPNIVEVERELDVPARDFRLWVCIHEETHRVQFTAVPWLRQHVLDEVDALVRALDTEPGAIRERLGAAAAAVGAALSGRPGPSLAEAVQGPEQQAVLDRLTAVLSLAEGHADVVMDQVGPDVIPSVDTLRSRFQRRRENPGRVDAAIRRLIGIDAKLAQYRDGATFVRGVVDRVGVPGFNRVWERPENLPTLEEIHDPAAWVSRVHGAGTW